MTRRIGIYSGTFDPVHEGHVAFARQALQACQLDEVVFLPERMPRDKQGVTELSQRIALLDAALAADPGLRVASLASEQFTVRNTLPEVRRLLGDAELTLLVGSDIVKTFLYSWEGLDILLGEVSLAIGLRAGDTTNGVAAIIRQLEQQYGKAIHYTVIRTPHAHAASSQIRASK